MKFVFGVRYDKENRSSINDLDEMRVITPSGQRVTLKDIASYSIERGDVAINHLEGRREIQVSADLKDPTGSATDILADIKAEYNTKHSIKISIYYTFL